MRNIVTSTSKYLCFILRHKPESINLVMDKNGWVSITELIEKVTERNLTHDLINIVAEIDDKQRFAISDDGLRIKANQGHSIDINLQLEPVMPPEFLFHGTAERFVASIKTNGLQKQQRHHVHMTESEAVATSVGTRYGKPVIITINSGQMYQEGISFYKTANNVWLVEHIDPKFLSMM